MSIVFIYLCHNTMYNVYHYLLMMQSWPSILTYIMDSVLGKALIGDVYLLNYSLFHIFRQTVGWSTCLPFFKIFHLSRCHDLLSTILTTVHQGGIFSQNFFTSIVENIKYWGYDHMFLLIAFPTYHDCINIQCFICFFSILGTWDSAGIIVVIHCLCDSL